jgi:uncharacterized membrane protein
MPLDHQGITTMNGEPTPTQTRLRDRLPAAPRREPEFRWRGTDVTRVEGLTDAVFAFAVTLLVVALEVPHSFEGLMDVVRGFPAFVICFAFLMQFWNSHYKYHRRYGLDDTFSRLMTMAILVLVLFFVYPLKFLFTNLTGMVFGLHMHEVQAPETFTQVQCVYVIYGAGFAGVWGLFVALYLHAWGKRRELALDEVELLHTRSTLIEKGIYMLVCLLSILIALVGTSDSAPGYIYFLLAPLQAANGWYHGRKVRALMAARAP